MKFQFTVKIEGELSPELVTEEEKQQAINNEYDGIFIDEFEADQDGLTESILYTNFPETTVTIQRDDSEIQWLDNNQFIILEQWSISLEGPVITEANMGPIMSALNEMMGAFSRNQNDFNEAFKGDDERESNQNGDFVGYPYKSFTLIDPRAEYKKNLGVRKMKHTLEGMPQVPQNVAGLISEFAVGKPKNTQYAHRLPVALTNEALLRYQNQRPGATRAPAASAAPAAPLTAEKLTPKKPWYSKWFGQGGKKHIARKTRKTRKNSKKRKSKTLKRKLYK